MKNQGKKVAVLIENGFEQVEMTGPVDALKKEGFEVSIVSPGNKVKGWNHVEWGDEFKTDVLLENADPDQFDNLLLPGGVMNPDKLRANPKAVEFVTHFVESGKPIAAICHGPWTLVETGKVAGFKMTSYNSIKTDLINGGVHWEDKEVITDRGIVTSRKPDDIPAFNKKMIEEFREGIHTKRKEKFGGSFVNREPVRNRLNENIDDRNFRMEENPRYPGEEL